MDTANHENCTYIHAEVHQLPKRQGASMTYLRHAISFRQPTAEMIVRRWLCATVSLHAPKSDWIIIHASQAWDDTRWENLLRQNPKKARELDRYELPKGAFIAVALISKTQEDQLHVLHFHKVIPIEPIDGRGLPGIFRPSKNHLLAINAQILNAKA